MQDINTKVRTTTTTYTDIKPLYVGYCLECAKQAHEAKQEQKASEKPKPTYLIASIICALLMIPGVIGTVRLMGSLGRVGLWSPGGRRGRGAHEGRRVPAQDAEMERMRNYDDEAAG